MESLCFSTYSIAGLPLSLAPFVQLGMIQVVLPRVSFAGHLAGILVGYACTWTTTSSGTPTSTWLWLYPSLVWPLWHLIYLLGIPPRLGGQESSSQGHGRRLGDLRSIWLSTFWQTRGMRLAIMVLACSIYALGWMDPLVWSFALVCVFWFHALGLDVDNSAALTWKRAFAVYALVLLVTHAATLSAWALLPMVWCTWRGILAITLQALILWSGLVWILEDVRHTEGIFHYTITCTVLQPLGQLQSIARSWRRAETDSNTLRSFPGQGRTLLDHIEAEMV